MIILRNKKLTKLYYKYTNRKKIRFYIKDTKNKLYKLKNRKTLTKEQKKAIDDFYIKYYGKKISYYWHEYAYSLTGKFDVRIIPNYLTSCYLQHILNNSAYCFAFRNKAFLPTIVNGIDGVRAAKIIASQTNEFNLKFNDNLISKGDLLTKLENIGECFIKPATDSMQGNRCLRLNIKNGIDLNSNKKIDDIINDYRNNFVIQELLTNCEQLKQISPIAVNTFRILTYMVNNKIYVSNPALKFAVKADSYVDNMNAGGVCIYVNPDGQLANKAMDLSGNTYEYSPLTNIKFSDVKIKNFDLIVKKCKEIHEKKLFMLGWLGFDVTLDKDNNIVIVEINTDKPDPKIVQFFNGEGAFGKNTEYMLNLIKNSKLF